MKKLIFIVAAVFALASCESRPVTGGRVTIPPLVFNRVMDILPISGWQVIQGADNSLPCF